MGVLPNVGAMWCMRIALHCKSNELGAWEVLEIHRHVCIGALLVM
jgi:hypothetical protein